MFLTIDVTVSFESEEYKGCSITDGGIVVTVIASRSASFPFTVIIWPVELPSDVYISNRARANVDFSNNPVIIKFNPGKTLRSGRVGLFISSLDKGTAFKLFELKLSIPANNKLTVNVGQQQKPIAAITC